MYVCINDSQDKEKETFSDWIYYLQVLELICTREAGAVFEAGGLQCSLTFIREFGSSVHKDTLHSAMNVVTRLCGRMEPQDTNLEACVKSLSTLLRHEDPYVSVRYNILLTKYYSATTPTKASQEFFLQISQ